MDRGHAIAGSHKYEDNGMLEIQIFVWDDDEQRANGAPLDSADSPHLTVPIEIRNVPPEITQIAASPDEINEGESSELFVLFNDPGEKDEFTVHIDWGDGVTQQFDFRNPAPGCEVLADFFNVHTFSCSHRYRDDPKAPDDRYPVQVTVTDDDGDADSASSHVTVRNVDPEVITPQNFDVNEGDSLTIVGQFTDPGTLDTHKVFVTWENGSFSQRTQAAVTQRAGGGEFEFFARFLDDHPDTGTPQDSFQVRVEVEDDDEGKTEASAGTLTINNRDPELVNIQISPFVREGDLVTLTGEIHDAGIDDTFDLVVEWGDSPLQNPVFETHRFSGQAGFRLTHRYLDDDPSGTAADLYLVTLTLKDDDTGETIAVTQTQVLNVAPRLVLLGPSLAKVGEIVEVSAVCTDPGENDTWTFERETGDGFSDSGSFTCNQTAVLQHQYDGEGHYPLFLRVTDDDGLQAAAVQWITITADQFAPQYDIAYDRSAPASEFANLISDGRVYTRRMRSALATQFDLPPAGGLDASQQVGLEMPTESFRLLDSDQAETVTIPANQLLVVNGGSSPDEIFAVVPATGEILAELKLEKDYNAVGITYHPATGHLFLLAGSTNRIVEIDPETGAEVRTYASPFSPLDLTQLSSGDITINPVTGNLVLASNASNTIHEVDAQGDVLKSHNVSADLQGQITGLAFARHPDGGRWQLLLSTLSQGTPLVDAGSLVPPAMLDETSSAASSASESQLHLEAAKPLLADAIVRWANAGLPSAELANLERLKLTIDDLPAGVLAWTEVIGGRQQITVDEDANGRGWFVDLSPTDDSEFSISATSAVLQAIAASPASGQLDLLTVLMHELGHLLGLDDVPVGSSDLMHGRLAAGVRKLPAASHVQLAVGSFAGSSQAVSASQPAATSHPTSAATPRQALTDAQTILNGGFEIADVSNPQFGWDVRGDFQVLDGRAVLGESGRPFARLSQLFTIPAGALQLRFRLPDLQFVMPGAIPPDALEVSLLDSTSRRSLVGAAEGLDRTAAFLNIQSDGTAHFAPTVSLPGIESSGQTLDADWTREIILDIRHIEAGTEALLQFELLGFGNQQSLASVDDVQLVLVELPPLSFDLAAEQDTGVPGDGITGRTKVDLVGSTAAGQALRLDINNDGTDDETAVADDMGRFTFSRVPLAPGENTVRIRAPGLSGTTEVTRTFTLDDQSPAGTLAVPAPDSFVNRDLGYVEIQWVEAGSRLDTPSHDIGDIAVSGVTIDRFEPLGDRLVRYYYGDDGDTLAEGQIDVTWIAGQVMDLGGNTNAQATVSFLYDTGLPHAMLVREATNRDLGYVGIRWNDLNSGVDSSTLDVTDLTITGLTIDRAQRLGDGLVVYWYGDDGETLTDGILEIHTADGAVQDRAGNPSAAQQLMLLFDTVAPALQLVQPPANTILDEDLGYIDVRLDNVAIDAASLGPDDLTISGVSIERAELLEDGSVRYWYNDDGQTLRPGRIQVTQQAAQVADLAGNLAEENSQSFLRLLAACPWQNFSQRFDSNFDTFVTPFDALVIINELNIPKIIGLNGVLPKPSLQGDFPPHFLDVNCDGFGTPLDVLAVINELNRRFDQQGEAAAEHGFSFEQQQEQPIARAAFFAHYEPIEPEPADLSFGPLPADEDEAERPTEELVFDPQWEELFDALATGI